MEIVEFYFKFELMDLQGGLDDHDKNNNRTTKAIAAAILMAGIVVAAAFLSGLLSLIDSNSTAIAHLAARPPLLNITGIDPNTTTGGGGGAQSSAFSSTQTGGGGSEQQQAVLRLWAQMPQVLL